MTQNQQSTARGQNIDQFSWIHLSDWHEGRPDFDRQVLLEKLIEDIDDRCSIDKRLQTIDAIIFSGDIAHSGDQSEYRTVAAKLIKPLRDRFPEARIVFAPGNHDLSRSKIADIPNRWNAVLSSKKSDKGAELGRLFASRDSLASILKPFENFFAFAGENGCDYGEGRLFHPVSWNKGERSIAVVAINTALCCARSSFTDNADRFYDHIWDYGLLSVSEAQMRQAIASARKADLRILVMHHPVNWMNEAEQPILDQLIAQNFDFVLHGHEHLPKFNANAGNYGKINYVPAGATFSGRNPSNPRYTNAYNFGYVDFNSSQSYVHNRRWLEEQDRWGLDDRYWPKGVAKGAFHPKRRLIDHNRKYQAAIDQQFLRAHTRRAAKSIEVTLKHVPEVIDGKDFIRATVRYRIDMHDGPLETFDWATQANERILKHQSESIRSRALVIKSVKPEDTDVKVEDIVRSRAKFKVAPADSRIEYQYEILECTDGVWIFTLGRFADHVKIMIETANTVNYEYLPLGGFPNLRPGPDGLLNHLQVDSYSEHLPHQGYLIQWYPKGSA